MKKIYGITTTAQTPQGHGEGSVKYTVITGYNGGYYKELGDFPPFFENEQEAEDWITENIDEFWQDDYTVRSFELK